MIDFAEALDFEPTKLREARLKIQAEHPAASAFLEGDADDSRLRELRARVERVAGDEEETEKLAWSLSRRESTTIVRAIGVWKDLRDTVAEIVRIRPKGRFLPLLWSAWQSYPHCPTIETLLKDLASHFGWKEAVGAEFSGPADGWFRAETGLVGIVRWLEQSGHAHEDLPLLPSTPFRSSAAFQDELFFAILTHGSENQLRAIPVKALIDGWNHLGPQSRMEAGRNYLGQVPAKKWSRSCLEDIRHNYGMPGGEKSVAAFWKPIAPSTKESFRRFFIEKDLETAFKRNTERHRYWRRWAGQIVEVRLGEASGVEWALMDFGRFAVLEFFEVGNAAYFYGKKDLRGLPFRRHAQPGDLKKQLFDPVRRYSDNRLIHGESWQAKAEGMVKAWQRHMK
jgi:hypothetical protein